MVESKLTQSQAQADTDQDSYPANPNVHVKLQVKQYLPSEANTSSAGPMT